MRGREGVPRATVTASVFAFNLDSHVPRDSVSRADKFGYRRPKKETASVWGELRPPFSSDAGGVFGIR